MRQRPGRAGTLATAHPTSRLYVWLKGGISYKVDLRVYFKYCLSTLILYNEMRSMSPHFLWILVS